ncbi:hypothetical protein K438DRAFT_2097937 [Mycena galopus ATCC 62051]|nr:hypothetical protein K438DRAFT_2097937 [Mycena galopus ATCC 62051]
MRAPQENPAAKAKTVRAPAPALANHVHGPAPPPAAAEAPLPPPALRDGASASSSPAADEREPSVDIFAGLGDLTDRTSDYGGTKASTWGLRSDGGDDLWVQAYGDLDVSQGFPGGGLFLPSEVGAGSTWTDLMSDPGPSLSSPGGQLRPRAMYAGAAFPQDCIVGNEDAITPVAFPPPSQYFLAFAGGRGASANSSIDGVALGTTPGASIRAPGSTLNFVRQLVCPPPVPPSASGDAVANTAKATNAALAKAATDAAVAKAAADAALVKAAADAALAKATTDAAVMKAAADAAGIPRYIESRPATNLPHGHPDALAGGSGSERARGRGRGRGRGHRGGVVSSLKKIDTTYIHKWR